MTDTDQLRALRASTDLLAIWDENDDFLGASAGVMALVSDDPLLGLATEGWTQLAAARARLDATHPVQRLRLVHATAGGGWAALDWCLCTAVGGIVIGQAVQAEGAHDDVKAALLREAIGALPDGFALFDPDDRLVLWNARYLQIFEGHPTPRLEGMRFDDIAQLCFDMGLYRGAERLDPDYLTRRISAHRRADGDLLQELPDGTVEIIKERRLPSGGIVGIHAVVTRLAQDHKAAVEASAAKSAFLSHMSHEIRTPLTGILGMIDLMSEEPDPNRQTEMLETIRASGRTLLGIVNDVLDVAKIEAGRLRLESIPFTPDDVLRPILMRHDYQAHGKGLALDVIWEGTPGLRRLGDPLRVGQVVDNLVSNAVKFTERGVVRITIANQEEGGLVIEVQDSGIGMTAEQVAQLSAPFQQADATIARRFGGTGLGMAIVGHILRACGGGMTVDSAPGIGTRFRVVLPLPRAVDAQDALEARRDQQRKSLRGMRALVADDNFVNREILGGFLTKLGLQCTMVEDGVRAVEAAVSEDFDIILLDISMPRMSGVEALQEMRRQRGRMPPVLAVTAFAMADQVQEMRRQGFDGHLGKPFSRVDLEAELLRVLEAAPAP